MVVIDPKHVADLHLTPILDANDGTRR
jgi:hypothetical protein